MTTVSDTMISSYERIQPDQSNSYDNAHGGEIVKEMDEKAAVCASRFTENKCVTAKISEVNFHTPIIKGETIVLTAYVYDSGGSSVNVHVRVDKEKHGSESKTATTANLIMVAVDEETNPVEFSQEVTIESNKDEELRRVAEER